MAVTLLVPVSVSVVQPRRPVVAFNTPESSPSDEPHVHILSGFHGQSFWGRGSFEW